MKQSFTLLTLALLCLTNHAQAQTYPLFNTSANIDIANIKAPSLVHGDMWHDSIGSLNYLEFPKGSGHIIGNTSALWMSAYDAQNNLKSAAQMYRQTGTDYWPGPVDSISTTQAQLYATSQNWAKIWKVNSSQIDAFLLLTTHTAANTPSVILEWPAKGNPYAKGAGGASLSITKDMAPFVDVNADGVYDPLAGDYPKMKGSQMLWWVINDAGPTHTVTGTNSMKMEIKMSAYAYKLGTVADNIIFYEYEVTNKSTATYSSYRIGLMADFDIGYAYDDYSGFDSSHRMGISYNGNNVSLPPAAGVAMMELPGDAYNSYAPLGSYRTFANITGAEGDPTNGLEFFRLMHSSNRVGQAYPNGSLYGTVDELQQCDSNVLSTDTRFVIASNNLSFSPGQTKKFGAALVVADSAGGCPNINFMRLHQTADTAYKIYWNPFRLTPPAAPTGIAAIMRSSLHIFPNPATDILHVETAVGSHGLLRVFDALGRSVALPQTLTAKGFELNTAILPAGVYTVRCQSDATMETAIFVKE
jgi:hypothetical protein